MLKPGKPTRLGSLPVELFLAANVASTELLFLFIPKSWGFSVFAKERTKGTILKNCTCLQCVNCVFSAFARIIFKIIREPIIWKTTIFHPGEGGECTFVFYANFYPDPKFYVKRSWLKEFGC